MDEDDGFFGSVLAEFPPVATAFAYGSAVFGQRGYSEAQKRAAMTDLVFVVDNAAEWHSTNLERHSAHYSGIGRLLGASLLARVQDEVGAGIYYNQCDLHGRRIKYGVVSRAALSNDLQHWSSLYVGGRMHKPVRTLAPWPADLQRLVAANRRSAVTASLLLPERFDADDVLNTIVGLSYGGDVRMGVGESHGKPSNIAAGQQSALAELYSQPLAELLSSSGSGGTSGGGRTDASAAELEKNGKSGGDGASGWSLSAGSSMMQDISLSARLAHLAALPSHAQHTLLGQLGGQPPAAAAASTSAASTATASSPSAAAVANGLDVAARHLWDGASGDEQASKTLASALRTSLSRIVRRSSLSQTVKGIATAGLGTSLAYAMAKMRKRSSQDDAMAARQRGARPK